MANMARMSIAERLTPDIMHQGFKEYESLEFELGHRVAKTLVAEEIGGQVLRQVLAEQKILHAAAA